MVIKPHTTAVHPAHPLAHSQVNDPPALSAIPQREHRTSFRPTETGQQREAGAVQYQRQ
ncbi:TPA: hypothetical protein ACU6JA_003016 [Salmonella enterica]